MNLEKCLNLVNNLITLGFLHLKRLPPEGCINFKRVSFNIFKPSELRIFWSSLFNSKTTEEKNEFRKKLCFTLNRELLIIFLQLYVLTEVGITMNRCFRHFGSPNFKTATRFSLQFSFSRGFQAYLTVYFLFRCPS